MLDVDSRDRDLCPCSHCSAAGPTIFETRCSVTVQARPFCYHWLHVDIFECIVQFAEHRFYRMILKVLRMPFSVGKYGSWHPFEGS